MASKKQRSMLSEGAAAPAIELADLGGTRQALRNPVLIAFFKVACPTCQFTFPFLERMYRGRTNREVRVFAISQDDPESTLEFHREFGITMPTLLDPEDEDYPASNAYGLSHVPSIFLVEPDGRISLALTGFDKKGLQSLGQRLGVDPFEPGEDVPEWKPG